MKHKKLLKAFTAIILSLLLSACAAASPSPEQADTPAAVTDMRGREITLPAEPVTKVVGLAPSDCEIICAIGAREALVGRGEYCDYPEELTDVPSVQSNYEMNVEQILALGPQVVFMGDADSANTQIKALEDAGITVVATNAYHEIAEVYKGIELIGAVMGRNMEAEALIAQMRATFEEISAKAAKRAQDKTVYFEISPLEYGLWTAGTGTFMDEIAQMLGVSNAFSDLEGWQQISEEQVLERDPDHIVTVTMYYGEGPTPAEEIASRPGWGNVSAVKSGSILNLQGDELSRPGPRLADGAVKLYDFIYGNDAS